MGRFVYKKSQSLRLPKQFHIPALPPKEVIAEMSKQQEIKEQKTEKVMDTREKVQLASEILGTSVDKTTKVKKVRKDKGLIERTESSKIVLTEDNKELLND